MSEKEKNKIIELHQLEGAMIAMIAKEAELPVETRIDILALLKKHGEAIAQLRDPRTPGIRTTGRPIDDEREG